MSTSRHKNASNMNKCTCEVKGYTLSPGHLVCPFGKASVIVLVSAQVNIKGPRLHKYIFNSLRTYNIPEAIEPMTDMMPFSILHARADPFKEVFDANTGPNPL